jgi:DNA polymerase-3 subunit beta
MMPKETVMYTYDHQNRMTRRNNEFVVHDGWQIVLMLDAKGKVKDRKERLLKILDLTREERLTLEYVEGKIIIDGDEKEHYELETCIPKEFPNIEEFTETAYHEIPAKSLQAVIRRTIFAVDPENIKYSLGGVSFEMISQVISIVATDGRRLAWQDCGGDCINNHASPGSAEYVCPFG